MKKIAFSILLCGIFTFGQQTEYQFTEIKDLTPTPVLNQGRTGTCWSFATVSFLESEVYRINGKYVDLSEMYGVRKTYPKKAYNYVYRQGKAQFGEGGLGHDILFAVADFGVVPQEEYPGMPKDQIGGYDHSELVKTLKSKVQEIVADPEEKLKSDWMDQVNQILDENMGKAPEKFTFEGKTYTPQTFAKTLNIHPEDYVTITSFTHHPDYSKFILEIPDNFANGTYYNLPLDEYMEVLETAVNNGFTAALDTDVSEKSFSAQQGMAIWPAEGKREDYFKVLLPEKWVTPQERQAAFEDYSTEDDHLMHITGILKDQLGNKYFDVKNSWGTNLANGGHVFMSLPYIRMKSIAFTVHKDALSAELKKKLGII